MKRNTRWALQLFIVSYAPLCAMTAVRHSDNLCVGSAGCSPSLRGVVFWLSSALAVYGFAAAAILVRNAGRKSSILIRVIEVRDEGAAVAAYLATYLLPFLAFDVESWRDLVITGTYITVLAVVFVRSELGMINPTLYLWGYRTQLCVRQRKDGTTTKAYVLSKHDESLSAGSDIYVVRYGNYYITKDDRFARPS